MVSRVGEKYTKGHSLFLFFELRLIEVGIS